MRIILLLIFIISFLYPKNYNDGALQYYNKNYQNALEIWIELAKNGDRESQYSLGALYSHGIGIKKDHKKALYYYKQAAKQGCPRALHKIGLYYYIGEAGLKVDKKKSLKFWKFALEKGFLLAETNISMLCSKNPTICNN